MKIRQKSIFSWGKPKGSPEELLVQDAQEELVDLDRDILMKELQLIDDRHRIMAQKAKKIFIANWMLNSAKQPSDESSIVHIIDGILQGHDRS